MCSITSVLIFVFNGGSEREMVETTEHTQFGGLRQGPCGSHVCGSKFKQLMAEKGRARWGILQAGIERRACGPVALLSYSRSLLSLFSGPSD